ncbi:hypothetical protein SOHN41_03826 [Shewanella sp. HN-41]|nr:hypothetical protein SOHN41_03826 [Shewanella sp. HN-41]
MGIVAMQEWLYQHQRYKTRDKDVLKRLGCGDQTSMWIG